MLAGPTPPEMGRMRVADSVRRSEANRTASTLAGARGRERRTRILGALGALGGAATAIRRRVARSPGPVTTPTVPTLDC